MKISQDTDILLISTSLNLGGSEAQAVKLANNLSNIEKKIHFISLKEGGILKPRLAKDIEVTEYNLYVKSKKKFFPKFRSIIWFIIASLRLRRRLKNQEITIISFLFHASFFGFLVSAGKKNIKHIVSIRSDRFTGRKKRNLILREIVMKILVIFSELVVFNSKTSHSKYSKRFNIEDKSKVINNFIGVGKVDLKLREKNSTSYKGIYVGRLDKLKNIDSLVNSFVELKKYDVYLDIYGEGSEFEYLKKLIQKNNLVENVKLKGLQLNIIEKSEQYDFLILTSFHEGYPNVIFEAMNNFLFTISTDVGDVKELINKDTGLIIGGFDADSISKAVKKYIKIPKNKKLDMVYQAYTNLNQNFNADNIIKSWVEII
tara:strand:- start:1138 stop:2256 length:1119 start_codon:yes stop_codon:yes gene_type:complete